MTDIMSKEARSRVMSRIHGKNTGIERAVARALRKRGVRPQRHASDLPGQPDFVFRKAKLAVFTDGDFWHGWRFPAWAQKLSPTWRRKIEETRRRDRKNTVRLRRLGWTVIRLWEHSIAKDTDECCERILAARYEALKREMV